MSKTVRITALLLILLTVAVSAWKARVRTTEWTETLRVAVYPVSGDDSPAVNAYIASLRRPAFDAIAVFMREQAQIHGLQLRAPVELYLAPRVAKKPPAPPDHGTPLAVIMNNTFGRSSPVNSNARSIVAPGLITPQRSVWLNPPEVAMM